MARNDQSYKKGYKGPNEGARVSPDITSEAKEQLENMASMIGLAIQHGNFGRARDLLNRCELIHNNSRVIRKIDFDTLVTDLALPEKIINALWVINARSIGQLLRLQKSQFVGLPNMGDRSWQQIVSVLADHGYHHGETKEGILESAKKGHQLRRIVTTTG